MSKERCTKHGVITHERLPPSRDYPFGAIKIIDRHHGEPCETIISLSPVQIDTSKESKSSMREAQSML